MKAVMLTAVAVLLAMPADAADLKVISAGAVRGVIHEMIEDYSKTSGVKFDFTVGPTGFLRDTIASGQHADLIIASAPLMAELEKTGKMTPGSRVDLGRIGLGVVIRDGAAAPNLSSADAFKQTLLNVKSIAFTDPKLGGTSTTYLMKVAEGLGIYEQVMRKGVFATGGNDAAAKVASGDADIAIVLISEIGEAKGAKLAAPFPEAIQLWTVYSAAIPASSTDPQNARAFIGALTGPALRSHWIAAGWEPATK